LCGHPAPRRAAGEKVAAGAPCGTVSSKWAKGTGGSAGDEHYNLIAAALRGNPWSDHAGDESRLIACQASQSGMRVGDQHPTFDSNNGSRRHHGVLQGMSVRRLTPKECARLQGFHDSYLDITYRGKPAADGNKYKALGNSMCVPVVSWLGKRIQHVEDTIRALADGDVP
jgi:DNA (cytosine-5)-methyltransferase 1